MDNSDGMQDEGNTEDTHLIERKESWTKMDRLLLVFAVLVYMGDGCETYLPGTSFLKYTTLMTIFQFVYTRKKHSGFGLVNAGNWLVDRCEVLIVTSSQYSDLYTYKGFIQYLFDSQYTYKRFI